MAASALGESDRIVSPHKLYRRLGKDGAERQASYRALFHQDIDDRMLSDIRQATNKAWVLGNDRFRQRIEELTQRQAAPKPKAGDKKIERIQGITKYHSRLTQLVSGQPWDTVAGAGDQRPL